MFGLLALTIKGFSILLRKHPLIQVQALPTPNGLLEQLRPFLTTL